MSECMGDQMARQQKENQNPMTYDQAVSERQEERRATTSREKALY